MPHVSRNKLDSKAQADLSKLLYLVFGKLTTSETETFLSSLLSETEKTMLAKRLTISLLLSHGMEKQEIAEKVHVTHETVSRIYSSMLLKPAGYKLANNIIGKDEMLKEIKTGILKLAGYTAHAAGGRVSPDIL